MSFSLFKVNTCHFNGCELNFATLHDLVQHIEETHIPIVEAELKRKEEAEKALALQQQSENSNSNETASKTTTTSSNPTPTLPLSAIYKLFPVLPPQKARPVKYEPTKISFCHYRKRPSPVSSVNTTSMYAQGVPLEKCSTPCRSEHDEELSNDSFRNDDGDDGESGDTIEERRHKCPVEGCNKRYKNLQGARYHARQVHGFNDECTGRLTPIETVLTNSSASQSPLTQPPTPNKYSNMRPYKCGQCSKRYKTQAGLSNHLHQAHQRVATTVSQSLTPNLVPVSPSALSNSSATHLHTSSTAVDTSHNTTIISSSSSKSAMPSNQIGMTVSNAVSQQQGTMRLSSNQPMQTAPPPTAAGHQYHQQVSASNQSNLSSQQNIQVRSVGVALSSGGNSRSSSNINSSMLDQQRISQSQYSAVIDPQPQIMSDQMQQRGNLQSGMQQQQQQQQQKMPGRVMSAGSNMALANRNAYHQHSANVAQSSAHRLRVSSATTSQQPSSNIGGGMNTSTSQMLNTNQQAMNTMQQSNANNQQQPQQQQQIAANTSQQIANQSLNRQQYQ